MIIICAAGDVAEQISLIIDRAGGEEMFGDEN